MSDEITSPCRDGWTDRPCQNPKCHKGQVDGEYGPESCGQCGGTGEEYRSELDERQKD